MNLVPFQKCKENTHLYSGLELWLRGKSLELLTCGPYFKSNLGLFCPGNGHSSQPVSIVAAHPCVSTTASMTSPSLSPTAYTLCVPLYNFRERLHNFPCTLFYTCAKQPSYSLDPFVMASWHAWQPPYRCSLVQTDCSAWAYAAITCHILAELTMAN